MEARFAGTNSNITKKDEHNKTGKLSTYNMPLDSSNRYNENIRNHYNDNNKSNINTNNDHYIKSIDYDYLVLALGSNTNFFGNKNLENASFTMKSLYDAFSIRSHIIDTLDDRYVII